MLKLRSRILLNNGISVVGEEQLASLIIQQGHVPDHIRTISNDATIKYKMRYGVDLSTELHDSNIIPQIFTSDDNKVKTVQRIIESPRHDATSPIAVARLDHELSFFYHTNNIEFLCVLNKLITKFKQDNVLWGCGRGSSCASYVLYLMEVHDVDPIKYRIDFKEFSKESNE